MAQHLLNVSPAQVVVANLSEAFHIKSEHTIKNYIQYLKQSFLLIGIQKYAQKSRVRLTQEKVYAVDVAMMDNRENAFAGENLGWRLETIVLVELQRRCKASGRDVYYLNERSGECDFVVCEGDTVVQAIQVSYDISSPKTRTREIAGLLLANKITKCTDLLLLTDHECDDIETNGLHIAIMPVYSWCLTPAPTASVGAGRA